MKRLHRVPYFSLISNAGIDGPEQRRYFLLAHRRLDSLSWRYYKSRFTPLTGFLLSTPYRCVCHRLPWRQRFLHPIAISFVTNRQVVGHRHCWSGSSASTLETVAAETRERRTVAASKWPPLANDQRRCQNGTEFITTTRVRCCRRAAADDGRMDGIYSAQSSACCR